MKNCTKKEQQQQFKWFSTHQWRFGFTKYKEHKNTQFTIDWISISHIFVNTIKGRWHLLFGHNSVTNPFTLGNMIQIRDKFEYQMKMLTQRSNKKLWIKSSRSNINRLNFRLKSSEMCVWQWKEGFWPFPLIFIQNCIIELSYLLTKAKINRTRILAIKWSRVSTTLSDYNALHWQLSIYKFTRAHSILAIFSLYIFCPLSIIFLMGFILIPTHRYTIDIEQNEVVAILSLISHWLCYANSAVNPLIYNFMSGK